MKTNLKNLQKNKKIRPLSDEQKALMKELQKMTISDSRRLAGRIRGLANIHIVNYQYIM
ncbi:hypothetical protein [Phocoenobacter skyensis]|uniref:ATP-dependent helicase HrpA n=1 Tax=Phocoenobacter skyensis TaxID=97481 RepID=A0A1H7WZJ2_9PAST|nr:hypothetical protein [Pasteurella skyensis]MDP8079264.1 hypothetical protein [Pasteurella skyensis]MDP8085517.1 hypothetical protein [Pasteurella skyensis]MDP8185130.1 hypothetical protein [Pasteurella skyensis]SEM26963.1 ATP-dependent helicase HrpA [Pasteurella skyensis]